MVSFSIASMFFHEYTTSEIFSFVSRTGLDAMEFWLETPHFWLRDLPVDEVISAKNDHPGIETLTVHAPILDLNPCSINPEVAQVSVEYAVQSLSIASQLGSSILTVHPGRRTAKRPPSDADFARFDHYISVLHDAAKKNTVKIGMENMEPIVNSLNQLNSGEISINIIYAETGPIGENDVMLASASKAIIIGFDIAADSAAQRLAEKVGVSIRLYDIIYRLTEDVEKAFLSLLFAAQELDIVN